MVTVNPVVPPVITLQPASVSVAKGFSASFSATATGSSTLFYQWLKNGQVIPNANSSYFSLSTSW